MNDYKSYPTVCHRFLLAMRHLFPAFSHRMRLCWRQWNLAASFRKDHGKRRNVSSSSSSSGSEYTHNWVHGCFSWRWDAAEAELSWLVKLTPLGQLSWLVKLNVKVLRCPASTPLLNSMLALLAFSNSWPLGCLKTTHGPFWTGKMMKRVRLK